MTSRFLLAAALATVLLHSPSALAAPKKDKAVAEILQTAREAARAGLATKRGECRILKIRNYMMMFNGRESWPPPVKMYKLSKPPPPEARHWCTI